MPTSYLIIGTGQSLEIGGHSAPAISTTPQHPGRARMLNTGVRAFLNTQPANDNAQMDPTTLTSLVDLAEETLTDPAYDHFGETSMSGCINHLCDQYESDEFIGAISGLGATRYALSGTTQALDQNWYTFLNACLMLTRMAELASHADKVPLLMIMHGEADAAIGTSRSTYKGYLKEWRRTYRTQFRYALQDSGLALPSFITQIGIANYSGGTNNCNPIALAQWDAQYEDPMTFAVLPLYICEYDSDDVHLTNLDQRLVGAYRGKAIDTYLQTGSFTPLCPASVSRSGAVIDLVLQGNVGQVVIDTTFVAEATNYGFTYTDDSGSPPAISSVTIVGTNTVRITLASDPGSATNKTLSYAMTGANAGRVNGPRGNIRDSDPTVSRDGDNLYNWLLRFELDVDTWVQPDEDSETEITYDHTLTTEEQSVAGFHDLWLCAEERLISGSNIYDKAKKAQSLYTALQPIDLTTLSGQPAIDFTGSTNQMQIQGPREFPVGDWSASILCSVSYNSSVTRLMGSDPAYQASAKRPWEISFNGTGGNQRANFRVDSSVSATGYVATPITPDEAVVLQIRFKATDRKVQWFLNNSLIGTYTLTREGWGTAWIIGGSALTQALWWTGKLCDILVAGHYYTDDEREETYNLLDAKRNAGPPVITSALTAQAEQGSNFAYAAAASGPGPITWSATGLPDGFSLDADTGIISATDVDVPIGDYVVALTATNSSGTDTVNLTISVVSEIVEAWEIGFNFRATADFVVDSTHEVGVPGTLYPAAFEGTSYGWDATVQTADNDAEIDRRFAGQNLRSNGSPVREFIVDLPDVGTYRIYLAAGSVANASVNRVRFFDGDTQFAELLQESSQGAGVFVDATGASHASYEAWITDANYLEHEFTSTTFKMRIGEGTTFTNATRISHLRLVGVDDPEPPTTAALVASATTIEGAATFVVPTYSGEAVLVAAASTLAGTSGTETPTYTATADLIAAASVLAAEAILVTDVGPTGPGITVATHVHKPGSVAVRVGP